MILSLLFLFFYTYSFDYTDCLDGAGSIVIDSVSVTPDPLVRGSDATVSGKVNVTKAITDGTCKVKLYVGILPLMTLSKNVCDYIECPLQAQVLEANETVAVPSALPAGSYKAEIHCTDSTGAEFICLKVNEKVK